jgi:urease accessory protein
MAIRITTIRSQIMIIKGAEFAPFEGHLPLLHLLHLSSPALPVGAYAYSQGLEYAIDSGKLKTLDDVADWLSGILIYGLGKLDLPVLMACYDACQLDNWGEINEWNSFLLASRETSELLLEDEQLGVALKRLLTDLGLPLSAMNAIKVKPAYAVMFALAGNHWHIPLADLAPSFAFSWLENQVAAATKIVPLGQTAAQKLLLKLLPQIPQAVAFAKALPKAEIGASLPGQVMASSLHEYQYSRLFRS